MRIILSLVLLIFALFPIPANASSEQYSDNSSCIVIGADLTDLQKEAAYKYFHIIPGSIPELSITSVEEKEGLELQFSESQAGSVCITSTFMTLLPDGTGLTIYLNNITQCTEEMYRNAIKTAGIQDALLKITSPYPVPGVFVLSSVFKAYEDLSGTKISPSIRSISMEELILQSDLASKFGSSTATEFWNQIKSSLVNSDESLNNQLIQITADNLGISIPDELYARILLFGKSYYSGDTPSRSGIQYPFLGFFYYIKRLLKSLLSRFLSFLLEAVNSLLRNVSY